MSTCAGVDQETLELLANIAQNVRDHDSEAAQECFDQISAHLVNCSNVAVYALGKALRTELDDHRPNRTGVTLLSILAADELSDDLGRLDAQTAEIVLAGACGYGREDGTHMNVADLLMCATGLLGWVCRREDCETPYTFLSESNRVLNMSQS